MIVEFSCKDTEKIWKGERTKKWNEQVARIALRKLFMLHAAHKLDDIRIPSFQSPPHPSGRLERVSFDKYKFAVANHLYLE